jgi:tetratricopeptide (TPR) repeat protein
MRSVVGQVYAFLSWVILGLAALPNYAQTANPPDAYLGNVACASCHAAIYGSYSKTAMAHASGPAMQELTPADFVHQPSGVHYRVYAENNAAWLSFERAGDPGVRGKRELLYFIGSGRRGRSYLFAEDGFLFESPINWYTDRHIWDMAPAYGDSREIPLNLPAFTSCLHCHVSGMQPPAQGTENRYPVPVFTQDGVGCERCHGPGAAHLAGGPIVNPAMLSPDRRDAVCMQCHLEANIAIERRGRHAYDFRPGDNLDDYVRHYIVVDGARTGLGAVSQFEALAQSTCKKKSGDTMSCMSCHDPHYSPSKDERTGFYRGKCLACHGTSFGAKHYTEQPDCTRCHMPSLLSADVAHTEVTDHRILRKPEISPQLLQSTAAHASPPGLVPFPYSKEAENDVRDVALAWESLVESGMTSAQPKAEQLLRSAMQQADPDPAVLSALGYVEQRRGDVEQARKFYHKALATDPLLIDAASNLGVIQAGDGHTADAIKLWQSAFEHAPYKSAIGMNLARVYCSAGQIDKARDYTLRVLEFNLDLGEAKQMLRNLNSTNRSCGH